MGMEKFAEIVQAKSGGKMKVNLFPAACWVETHGWCLQSRAARSKWHR